MSEQLTECGLTQSKAAQKHEMFVSMLSHVILLRFDYSWIWYLAPILSKCTCKHMSTNTIIMLFHCLFLSFFLSSFFLWAVHADVASCVGAILVLLFNENRADSRESRPVYPPCRELLRGSVPLCVRCRKCDRSRQDLRGVGLQSALWVPWFMRCEMRRGCPICQIKKPLIFYVVCVVQRTKRFLQQSDNKLDKNANEIHSFRVSLSNKEKHSMVEKPDMSNKLNKYKNTWMYTGK